VQVGIQVYSGDAPATGAVTFPITIVFGIDTVTD
jgi:hypothetical protein